jgi:hypothetical protein
MWQNRCVAQGEILVVGAGVSLQVEFQLRAALIEPPADVRAL